MQSSRHFIATVYFAVSVLLASLAGAAASPVGKTWHFEGFKTVGNAGGLAEPLRLNGTVDVTTMGLAFQTNQGAFFRSAPLAPRGAGFEFEDYRTKKDPERPNTEINVSSTQATLTPVDGSTWLLVYGHFTYGEAGGGPLDGFEWYAGLLTETPVPARVTPLTRHPVWAGRYTATHLEYEGNNFQNGIFGGPSLGAPIRILWDGNQHHTLVEEDDDERLAFPPGSFDRLRSFYTDDEELVRLTMSIYDSDSGEYLGIFSAYNVLEREDNEVIYLGDGRLLLIQTLATLLDAESYYFALKESFEYPTFVAYTEVRCSLLVPQSIGKVTKQVGSATILRNGRKFPIGEGDLVYEGDLAETGATSMLKIEFDNQTSSTFGAKTVAKVERYVPGKPGIINLLKGYLRSFVLKDSSGEVKLMIKTTNTVTGVRGTEFEITYDAEGEVPTTTLNVFSGLVEMNDLTNGQVSLVGAGEGRTASGGPRKATLTIQRPGDVMGLVVVNGDLVVSYPHTLEVDHGTTVALGVLAGKVTPFHRWWGGGQEYFSGDIELVVSGDMVLQCEFLRNREDAADAYWEAAEDANLDEDRAEPHHVPFGDGLSNLVKWAFNLDLGRPDRRVLGAASGGVVGGLPALQMVAGEGGLRPEFHYLRRSDGSLRYRPMVSEDLVNWQPLISAETVTPEGPGWERVKVSLPAGARTQHFRVEVWLGEVD